jgi:hypothetical protein
MGSVAAVGSDEKAHIQTAPYNFFSSGFKSVLFWSKKDLKSKIIQKLLK